MSDDKIKIETLGDLDPNNLKNEDLLLQSNYRKGYQQGAAAVFAAVFEHVSVEHQTILGKWMERIQEWRSNPKQYEPPRGEPLK